nr:unnamed protein product [Haemonchus contortus]
MLVELCVSLCMSGTESRKCSTEEGVKEHEVCEFVLDFLHDTCDIKDFYSRGRTKILQEKEGCNITVLDSDATRVVCSCYSGDFCTEKLRILEVFNEEKFESKSGLNYSQCLQLALRKGPFLPIERFRETGEGERNLHPSQVYGERRIGTSMKIRIRNLAP